MLPLAPRERVPLDWAMTQMNLGNALGTLGEREAGTARLEDAVAAYRAALEERTRERVPLDWAMTQMNLGNALRTLGEREARRGSRTPSPPTAPPWRSGPASASPLDWAATTGMEGVALTIIAEWTANSTMAARAVEQIMTARDALREGGHTPWAAYLEKSLEAAEAVRDALQGADTAAR